MADLLFGDLGLMPVPKRKERQLGYVTTFFNGFVMS